MAWISSFLRVFVCAAVAVLSVPALALDEVSAQASDIRTVAQFARVIDDLPLMPGLVLHEEKDLLFTAGEGRIAQTEGEGSVDIDAVYNFYAQTLPQLGWRKIDARSYDRDKETLRIEAKASDRGMTTVVRFSLEPSSFEH